jgi:hypothetical protein
MFGDAPSRNLWPPWAWTSPHSVGVSAQNQPAEMNRVKKQNMKTRISFNERSRKLLSSIRIQGALLLVAAGLTMQTHGQGISVQLVGDSNSERLAPNQAAGVVPLPSWNLYTNGNNGVLSNLTTSSGAVTSAKVQVTYLNGEYQTGANTSTPDGVMMSGGVWSGGGYTVAFTDSPYEEYDVYVYILNDNPLRRFGLTLGSQTYWGQTFSGNGLLFPDYFIQATETTDAGSPDSQTQATYVCFTNITGTNFTITGVTPDGNIGMMGIQIVNTTPSDVGPPVIVNAPQEGTNFVATTAAFSVSANGAKPLAYQWQFNGTNLTDGSGISGSRSTDLTLSNLSANQSGNYRVVITNYAGSVTSAVATLVVVEPYPVITSQPQSLTSFESMTTKLTVVSTGVEPLIYQWRFNGADLSDDADHSGSQSSTLILNSLSFALAGKYTVVIANDHGSVTSSPPAVVTVLSGVPTIMNQPQSTSNYLPSGVAFTVAASGPPPLTCQWRANGVNLADGGNILGSQAATLVLTSTSVADMVAYEVVVANAFGSVTSSVATYTGLTATNMGISLQFQGNAQAATLTPDLVGGAYPLINWNVVNTSSGQTTTPGSLVDSSNAVTPATVTASFTAGHWVSGCETVSADGILNSGGIWSGGGFTVTVSNIPYASFDVYVYMLNDWTASRYGLTVTNSDWAMAYPAFWGATFAGHLYPLSAYCIYTEATNTTSVPVADMLQANCVHWTGVVGTNLTINCQTPDGNVAMTGIQIINNPGGTVPGVVLKIAPGTDGNRILTWPQGTLLQATEVTGPWTTNSSAVSPFTVTPTNTQNFFRVFVR